VWGLLRTKLTAEAPHSRGGLFFMGYRSTLVSQHYPGKLPEWFIEKWGSFIKVNGVMIYSIMEFKIYEDDIFVDYHKALNEIGFFDKFSSDDFNINITVIGEDGFISKVSVSRYGIKYYWATDFIEQEMVWTS